jgi:hypothetical protein
MTVRETLQGLESRLREVRFDLFGFQVALTPELLVESFIDFAVVLGIYAFLLGIFTPELMLSQTITAGGDTASHYYPAKYLRDELLPRGHVIGWLPGWYVGMPLFQYYFPLPFVLIAVLGYVIPLQISFKLVTVLGVFLLPLCAYGCMKFMGFRFPAPAFAATFTLPFLFMESHSMWGGNIPSTLAGEFSYSISLSLTILFFGTLYRGLYLRKHVLHNAVLLAVVALTHVYTVLWAVASSTYILLSPVLWVMMSAPMLLVKKRLDLLPERIDSMLKELKAYVPYMMKAYPLAFMLTGFWIVPLLVRLKYTTSYDIPWNITEDLLPPILWPFLVFSAAGIVSALHNKDNRAGFLCYSILPCIVFFLFASKLGVVDIRFLPFIYLMLMMLAAYGLSQSVRRLRGVWLVPLIALLLTVFWVDSSKAIITGEKDTISIHTDQIMPQLRQWKYTGFTPYWVKWNYEGFENKQLWPEFKETNDYLRGGYGDPRAQFEHNDQHNAAGTVRAFESIPLFSGRSILEGLYMQSIISSPFVFYIQSEVSEQQSCPFWAVYPCTSFNLKDGTEHLKMFNVRYIVARSQKLKDAMRENAEWALAYSADPYEVWELTTNPDHYVTVPSYEPVLYRTGDWKNISYQWFRRPELIDTPIVFKKDVETSDSDVFKSIVTNPTVDSLDSLPKTPVDNRCNIREIIGAEEMEFSTDCVGKPHIISVSYYPSWVVYGADRVYMVSPSFMLVYPKEERVRLVYSKLPEDWFGISLSVLGAGIICYAFLTRDQRTRRFFSL